MPERKTELVSFRVTPTFKRALRRASEDDARSQANFLEKLVLDYCAIHKLDARSSKTLSARTVERKASVKART
jgi:hypothetical protein